MTPSTSNIIPFPFSRVLPAVARPSAGPAFFAPTGADNIPDDDHTAHVTAIVRASIGFARRKGACLDSLPPQLRSWLLDLCDKGDPTCRMLRDWLTGNSRFCAGPSREGV